jgi:hypothetical protein
MGDLFDIADMLYIAYSITEQGCQGKNGGLPFGADAKQDRLDPSFS